MKKTKIVCTLGPASNNEATIKQMLLKGMNVARFNLSHGTHEDHKKLMDTFRKVRDELSLPAALLLDTRGPEIRVKKFINDAVILKNNQPFTLTIDDVLGDENQVAVTYPNLVQDIHLGCKVLIDDGKIEMIVQAIEGRNIHCLVTRGGRISNNKGINIPSIHLSMPYLSETDKQDLLFGIKEDVDYVAASFIRSKEDVQHVRRFLDDHGGEWIRIISKIENQQGIDNFESILANSDGIMVARGDMGVEVDYEKLPGIQKQFITRCYQSGKVVITATQMLESMITNTYPTRAEISDVANAVFDGTSALMLSGETANGAYPVQAVESMSKIAIQAEKDIFSLSQYQKISHDTCLGDVTNAISDATCTTARDVRAKAIIAVTKSGKTARNMSKFRPEEPIIAPTHLRKTYHQLSLNWGVYPIEVPLMKTTDEMFKKAIKAAKDMNYVANGDIVVISAGVPLGTVGGTNLIKVQVVTDEQKSWA